MKLLQKVWQRVVLKHSVYYICHTSSDAAAVCHYTKLSDILQGLQAGRYLLLQCIILTISRDMRQHGQNKMVLDGEPAISLPPPANVSVTLTFELITLEISWVHLAIIVRMSVSFGTNPFSGLGAVEFSMAVADWRWPLTTWPWKSNEFLLSVVSVCEDCCWIVAYEAWTDKERGRQIELTNHLLAETFISWNFGQYQQTLGSS